MKNITQRLSRVALLFLLLVGATGCSSESEDSLTAFLDGIGRLPGDPNTAADGEGGQPALPAFDGRVLGSDAKGNRLLVIGDSIFASTAARYGNDMCRALVPLGWRVAVEAEANRQIRFGREVLTERLSEGWDAAVIFLGTNFNGNFPDYESDLDRIVSSLAPRPTLLLTTSLFRPVQQQINDVIRRVAGKYDNVRVLDWTTISANEGVLSPDRVHPSVDGRALLALAISQASGVAPTSPGACLEAVFKDDQLEDISPQDTLAPPTDPDPEVIPTPVTSTTQAPVVTSVPTNSTPATTSPSVPG